MAIMGAAMTPMTLLSRMSSRYVIISVLTLVIFTFLYSSAITYGMIGFGTLQSKLLISRTGVTSSSLLVASPSQSEALIIGTAPLVTTSAVSSTGQWGGTTHATLNGNMSNLQGAALAVGFFEWGYSPALMTTTTTPQTLFATGAFSTSITGYDHNKQVYYRAIVESDGISYGSTVNFLVESGTGGFLLKQLISSLLAAGICLVSLKFAGGNLVGVLISVLIGIVGFVMILSILG